MILDSAQFHRLLVCGGADDKYKVEKCYYDGDGDDDHHDHDHNHHVNHHYNHHDHNHD